jgi:hypothetical protein
MTQTTGQQVIAHLQTHCNARAERGGKWRSNSPYRPGSDSMGFVLTIDPDGEHGAYIDFPAGQSGSLYALADYLKIPTPRKEVTSTKRTYANLEEYAIAHGATLDAYERAKWSEGERKGRKALLFQTQTGERARFMDGNKPTYDSPTEYVPCWYGLDKAVALATEQQLPIILCNGEASVVAGLHHGLPVACKTGGESALTDSMIQELDDKWTGDIILAPDCDMTGDNWRKTLQAQLGHRARVAELGLTNGGDLADFCMLHGDRALRELQRSAFTVPEQDEVDPHLTSISSDAVYSNILGSLHEPDGLMSIENPYRILHQYGGIAHIIAQNEIMGIVAPSGGGKTIWMETGVFNLMQRGVHSILISGEWMDKHGRKFGNRLMQRMGGPTYNQMQAHQLALRAEASGRSCNGYQKLDSEQVQKAQAIVTQLREMPGRNCYGTVPGLSAEGIVKAIRKYYQKMVAAGNKPSAVWIDYGQQLWLENQERSSRMPLDVALEIIREVCNQLELALFVASQMKKSDADKVRDGGEFELSAMQWMSEQPFQLLLFAVPHVADGVPQRDKEGNALLRARIMKNSTAGPSPEFYVPWCPERLMVYDARRSTAGARDAQLTTRVLPNLPAQPPATAQRELPVTVAKPEKGFEYS